MRSSLRPAVCLLALLSLAACGGGDARLEELLAAARSTEADEQRRALQAIGEMGADAAPAIPDLIALSVNAGPEARRLSSLALAEIAGALPIDEFAPERAEIVDALANRLGDEEQSVRNTAAFGLLAIDPSHTAAQGNLQDAMRRGDGGIIDRLTKSRPPPIWATPTLIDILREDPRPGLRRLAAVGLGEIAPDSEAAEAALRDALQDSDDRVRLAARTALGM
ncbi:MAG: hypothetical protein DWQ34_14325 [Planctomycetota bacterium]|nr:MAG: hypothetical protein DWQ34_14325 [Planctomycetota bacterium]REK20013.1 MAG: hypothetical protein DWQ41_27230 [Planctomycetota bacterium]REK27580.1 MAG: hypothetical protein DWQ45_26250 [Planctomycetota bacterium]